MSQLEVDKIIPQSGTTLTIGESGDTISFASGVLPALESLTITGDLTVDTDTLYVDSSNNRVGIGTSSPSKTLDVVGASGCIRIDNTAGTPDQELMRFEADMGTNDRNFLIKSPSTDSASEPFRFTTSNAFSWEIDASESMRIDSSGNVLIGTSDSTTDLAYSPKLKVSGSGPALYLEETDSGQDWSISATGGNLGIRDATSSSSIVVIEAGQTSEAMRIDSSGNVGIGTSSPLAKTTISFVDAAGNGIALQNRNTGSVTTKYSGVNYYGTDTVGSNKSSGYVRILPADINYVNSIMSFGTRIADTQAERMRIDSSGNVGIGTSSPSQALDVVGSIEVSDSIYLGGTGSANALDDYEEGTFDPDLTFGGGDTGLIYSQRQGDYTKIGQAVFFTIKISLSNKGTSTGDAVISLPFSVKNTGSWTQFEFVAMNFCLQNCTPAHEDGVAICSDAAGGLIITQGQNSQVELTNTAFNNNSNFRITGSFITDD